MQKSSNKYQTLINLYLNDVVENKKELKLKWE